MSHIFDQNKNARIATRTDKTGKSRTETQRRDFDSTVMAISTNDRSNSTNLFIDTADGERMRFNGREARTLYRLLRKHYKAIGKGVRA